MKHYRMHAEEKDHFVMHDKRDNKHFKVAKSGLSKEHMDKVRKMAGGGLVDDETQIDNGIPTTAPTNVGTLFNTNFAPQAPAAPINPQESANFATPEQIEMMKANLPKAPKEEAPKMPMANPNTAMPEDSGMKQTSYPISSTGTAAAVDNSEKFIAEQSKALNAGANAARSAANDQARAYEDNAKAMAALYAGHQQNKLAIDKDQEALTQDYTSGKLDPNRVWNNASTGNKILAGIGVLLSGIGSGITGGPNLAMQVLHKTIDDDVAAQKLEMDKKHNLMTENLKRYGTLEAATNATALQLSAALQSKIALSAAKMGATQSQSAADLAITQLKQNDEVRKQALASETLKGQIINQGGGQNLTPDIAEKIAPGRWINTAAGIKIAKSPEEAKKLSEMTTLSGSIDKQIGDMMKFASKTGTTAPGTTNNTLAKGLQTQLMLDLKTIDQLGVLSKGDLELMQDLVPNPGAVMTDKAIAQLAQLRKIYKDKVQAAYANHLVNPAGLIAPPTSSQDVGTGMSLTNWKK